MIWRYIIPEPRIVPVRYEMETCTYKPCIFPPVILQVNRESRHEGLERYRELLLGPRAVTGCYVDLSIDTVYLTSNVSPANDPEVDPTHVEGAERGRLVSPPLRRPTTYLGEASNGEALESQTLGVLPNCRHSKIIFDDLMRSPDGQQLFKSFHIEINSWRALERLYRYYRHRLPFKLKELCIVYERVYGPLGENLKIQSIVLHQDILPYSDVEKPAYYTEDQNAIKLASSFAAQYSWLNRKDKNNGLTPFLCHRVVAKSLHRAGEMLSRGVRGD
jgi:hypothetical protein